MALAISYAYMLYKPSYLILEGREFGSLAVSSFFGWGLKYGPLFWDGVPWAGM